MSNLFKTPEGAHVRYSAIRVVTAPGPSPEGWGYCVALEYDEILLNYKFKSEKEAKEAHSEFVSDWEASIDSWPLRNISSAILEGCEDLCRQLERGRTNG